MEGAGGAGGSGKTRSFASWVGMPEAAEELESSSLPRWVTSKEGEHVGKEEAVTALKVICLLWHLFQTLLGFDTFDPGNFLGLFRETKLLQKRKGEKRMKTTYCQLLDILPVMSP
jgi:hypothetical protein